MTVTDARTLIELLELRALETPDRIAFTWDNRAATFKILWEEIRRFATHLIQRQVKPGDRVVLALPNGPEFFPAFYGTQLAGALPVPLFPGSGAERLAGMAKMCEARIMILPSTDVVAKRAELASLKAAGGIVTLSVSESAGTNYHSSFPAANPDDIAFIQYTSGSTGLPKGVMLSHRSLLRNISQLIEGMQITPADIFVSWLPVYHDMGLILKTMVPFYLAADLHLLPTTLSNIGLWLDAIQRTRATLVAAPDFAYRWCLRFVRNPASFDLSSLRVALNAAEPVRLRTIMEFERAFGLRHVMIPGYGLAEATVGVCTWIPGQPILCDDRGIVSVGKPFTGIHIQIVEHEVPVRPGEIGEIMIQSPARTAGYFASEEETRALFWNGDYIRTGDLGYLDREGHLFVTGRAKNIIKHGGETIFPQEVEQIVDGVSEIRRSAAVGVDRGGVEGEQLYLFAELRKAGMQDEGEFEAINLSIVNSIFQQIGIRPGRVYFLRPRSIPLTHNGKIQYSLLREIYADGRMRAAGDILFPAY